MLHHRRAINYNNNHKGDLVDLMTAVLISLVILFSYYISETMVQR